MVRLRQRGAGQPDLTEVNGRIESTMALIEAEYLSALSHYGDEIIHRAAVTAVEHVRHHMNWAD